jgi:O-6-methylguanine DNA methyltransferase
VSETVWWSEVESRFGTFGVASTSRGLLTMLLPRENPNHQAIIRKLSPGAVIVQDDGHNAEAVQQLREYLAGERQEWNLTLDMRGTPFQVAVWKAVYDVPYGQTVSYGEIARKIGNPAAVRAVGAANGANPLPPVVPCHRIIGSNGKLTGYGGGLPLKQKLLDLERVSLGGEATRTNATRTNATRTNATRTNATRTNATLFAAVTQE